MSKHGRILVAMSGGIDSSMAALMLHEEGYDVIGITMKTWDYQSSGSTKKETGCCSLDSINDARNVAVRCGFPHYVLDIRKEFGNFVIDNFIEEYLAGRTPNPCVLCNTKIKWEELLHRSEKMDCEWMATGHYANIRFENGRYIVSKGKDLTKDQSYVLWGLKQESLKRTIFPLGKYHKKEIRKLAEENGFSELARKSESYEICFIPDNDYREFLKYKVERLEEKVADGDYVSEDGKIIGKHKGYPFYTIGQRKGLETAFGHPMYVTEIIPETNTVFLGEEEKLFHNAMTVQDINLIKHEKLDLPMQAVTKIRYKDSGTLSRIIPENKKVKVIFERPVRAITPGQAAVFYECDDVIGGGWIENYFDSNG